MGKYKTAVKALADAYNYFDTDFLKKLRDDIERSYLRGSDTFILMDNIDNGMDQLLYCWLVMMYGDYGVSPRVGWINDMKEAVKWLDEFMEGWEDGN